MIFYLDDIKKAEAKVERCSVSASSDIDSSEHEVLRGNGAPLVNASQPPVDLNYLNGKYTLTEYWQVLLI